MTGHPLTLRPEWEALEAHADSVRVLHMRDLFAADPDRFSRFSFKLGPLLVDYSKNSLTSETMGLLLELAQACAVDEGRAAMFAGKAINFTENRPALHVALRKRGEGELKVGDEDVMPDVRATLARIKDFSERIRSGEQKGCSGKTFRHVVNIGIGGSHIGPMLVSQALKADHPSKLSAHFIANLDESQFLEVIHDLDPAETIFVVCSKSFSTAETMANAQQAREWLTTALGPDALRTHMVAVTAHQAAALNFGVSESQIFPMWDWVGGRYSLWSATSLAAVLANGHAPFEQLLAGAEAMDEHFRTASLDQNLPVLLAMVGIWNINFLGASALAILPYDHALRSLAAHIQQLDMESNGKGVTSSGMPAEIPTGPVVFGGAGSESQHSFFQLIHQSPHTVSCDFIAAVSGNGSSENRDHVLSNVFGQAEALMMGRSAADMPEMPSDEAVHKAFPGNRPSNVLLLDDLSPYSVGMLVALYEHKVFVQSLIWDVNAFDQWGVELGKALATKLTPALSGDVTAVDKIQNEASSSTLGLIDAYLKAKSGAS